MVLDRLRALMPIFCHRAGSRSELQLTDTVKEEDLGAALQRHEISICFPTKDRIRNLTFELTVGAIGKAFEVHENRHTPRACI